MRVDEVMTEEIVVAAPGQTVAEVARRMRELDVGALPVGLDGRLLGMVTDRDLVTRAIAAGRDPASTPIAMVMTANPVWCHADQSVEDAVEAMELARIRRLPVIERASGRLVGILTLSDVMLRTGNRMMAADLARELAQPGRN